MFPPAAANLAALREATGNLSVGFVLFSNDLRRVCRPGRAVADRAGPNDANTGSADDADRVATAGTIRSVCEI
jgi:hypothetical protein